MVVIIFCIGGKQFYVNILLELSEEKLLLKKEIYVEND